MRRAAANYAWTHLLSLRHCLVYGVEAAGAFVVVGRPRSPRARGVRLGWWRCVRRVPKYIPNRISCGVADIYPHPENDISLYITKATLVNINFTRKWSVSSFTWLRWLLLTQTTMVSAIRCVNPHVSLPNILENDEPGLGSSHGINVNAAFVKGGWCHISGTKL